MRRMWQKVFAKMNQTTRKQSIRWMIIAGSEAERLSTHQTTEQEKSSRPASLAGRAERPKSFSDLERDIADAGLLGLERALTTLHGQALPGDVFVDT
jgi:hypothetical protein